MILILIVNGKLIAHGMLYKRKSIKEAKKELKANLDKVARVNEWARLMGYAKSKLFSRHFIRFFKSSPQKVLIRVRVASILHNLNSNKNSYRKIAWKHSFTDEKALYNFIKRHTKHSPTEIKNLSKKDLNKVLRNFRE